MTTTRPRMDAQSNHRIDHRHTQSPARTDAIAEAEETKMTPAERVAYGVTGALFATNAAYVGTQLMIKANETGLIGDPNLPTSGVGVVLGLITGTAACVYTGIALLGAAIRNET